MMMTRIITYNLRAQEENSDKFYREAEEFAQDWYQSTLPIISNLIKGFSEWRQNQNLVERAPISCAFDLLVLGVLLMEHGEETNTLMPMGGNFIGSLLSVQNKYPKLEGLIKISRGFLLHFLTKPSRKKNHPFGEVEALTNWLIAIGEDNQAKRILDWKEYFKSLDDEKAIFRALIKLSSDFEIASEERLGKFTEKVETFLQGEAKKKPWRYDKAFIQRSRVEYHMAMVGNVILNKVNRESFLQTKMKVVILPPCMRALDENDCKAVMTQIGQHCAGCTVTCRVHQVTKLGEKYGFEVYIIPDEIREFAHNQGGEKVGLVGVSCVLTNWGGGWETENLGIPAQGVLLDFVGCKFHWDKKGFPTDINISQLVTCLGCSGGKVAGGQIITNQ